MLGGKKGGLLLAGLAAYAYYKYTKMSEMEKRNMVNNLKEKGQNLKEKGQDLYDRYVPSELKKVFGKKETPAYGAPYPEGETYAV